MEFQCRPIYRETQNQDAQSPIQPDLKHLQGLRSTASLDNLFHHAEKMSNLNLPPFWFKVIASCPDRAPLPLSYMSPLGTLGDLDTIYKNLIHLLSLPSICEYKKNIAE